MNKYISRILLLLVSVSFLGNSARAEESVFSGKNALLCMGVIAVGGLIKLGCNYARNYNMRTEMNMKLKPSTPQEKEFFFQNYRIINDFNDMKVWKTASEIHKNQALVKKTFFDDLQSNRIKVPNENGSLNSNLKGAISRLKEQKEQAIKNLLNSEKNRDVESKTIKRTFQYSQSKNSSNDSKKTDPLSNIEKQFKDREKAIIREISIIIVENIDKELFFLLQNIQKLNAYTDVFRHIDYLLAKNQAKYGLEKIDLSVSENMSHYFVVFSSNEAKDFSEFTTELKKEIQKHNTWWKNVLCPRYEELSLQCWDFMQRYIRTYEFRNTFTENNIEVNLDDKTSEDG